MSSNVYRAQDAPHYTLGHSVILGYLSIGFLFGSILHLFLLRRENEKRRTGQRSSWTEGLSEEDIKELGDRRYVSLFPTLPYC
jgi:hypothetical protein